MAELYIVATPMGNLEDITLRALAVLKSVAWIAAEDTRHTQRLLAHYGVEGRLLSLHDFNEQQRAQEVIDLVLRGESVALVSDAGTPLISDPGYRVVTAAHAAGVTVVPVPGPCAAIAALSASGLPTDHFVFEGFLPPKGERRHKRLVALQDETRTVIFYEAVHRIVDLLTALVEVFGPARPATLARELTKKFETIRLAPLAELLSFVSAHPEQQRGEFVLVVGGAPARTHAVALEDQAILKKLLAALPLKQAVKLTQEITGARRHELYTLALQWKGEVVTDEAESDETDA